MQINKRFLSVAAAGAIVASAFVFTGCGDDSSSIVNNPTGSLTGILDPMAGVSFNTSSGVRGTTDSTGAFTFNRGDKVTFTIGSLSITTSNNLTSANVSINPATDVVPSNATLHSNLLELRDTLAADTGATSFVFSSDIVSALATNLANKTAAIVAAAPKLTTAQQNKVTTILGVNVSQLATNSSLVTTLAGLNLTAVAQNATRQAFQAKAGSINTTGLGNKVLWINGTAYPITATSGANITISSGSYMLGGNATAGTELLKTDATKAKIDAVMYNLSASGIGSSNKSIKILNNVADSTNNATVYFYTNGSFKIVDSKAGNVTGNYSLRADGLGVDILNRSDNNQNATLTFEDDPTNVGVIANYWEKITTTTSTLLKSLASYVMKVITALA